MADIEAMLLELVEELTDDWCDVGWVLGIAIDAGLDEASARDAAMQVIETGMDRGLMVAGDVTARGFAPWAEQGAAAAMRIRKAWWAHGTDVPHWDLFAWFEITDAGAAFAAKA